VREAPRDRTADAGCGTCHDDDFLGCHVKGVPDDRAG
jgi:hypothetical protein